MDFKDYVIGARTTAMYELGLSDIIVDRELPLHHYMCVAYVALGLAGEAAEVANKTKKLLRGDIDLIDLQEQLRDELGDVLWYVANMCYELGLDPNDIMQRNLDKLADRQARGKIQGSGDDR